MKGIKVKFNKYNRYGDEKCCCEKGYYTKFGSSTLFCFICNLICARRLFKTNSWCKKNGWDKTCTTCNQCGDYKLFGDGICKDNKE